MATARRIDDFSEQTEILEIRPIPQLLPPEEPKAGRWVWKYLMLVWFPVLAFGILWPGRII